MRKNVISILPGGALSIDKSAASELLANGTYLPEVERVVFNLKTEDRKAKVGEDGKPATGEDGRILYETTPLANPVLTTKVWWSDGTTTTVKNSPHDRVETEEVDVGGRKVTVATDCSKEVGVAMAVVKRTCGVPGPNGEIEGAGMGKILRDIVRGGFDQRLEEAKAKAAREAKSKAKAEGRQAAASPKNKRYSTYRVIQLLGRLLEKIEAEGGIGGIGGIAADAPDGGEEG